MGFRHRSRSPAQTTNERTYDVLPNPDIFQSHRQQLVRSPKRHGIADGRPIAVCCLSVAVIRRGCEGKHGQDHSPIVRCGEGDYTGTAE
jgi:hypothetical protein